MIYHPVRALRINVLVEEGIEQGQLFLRKVQRHIAPENFQERGLVFRKV
jgi:hypothetical protein